jgi:Lrp/AsnC family transcriptional regulator, leucine-responsive regulatory protein
MGSLCEAENFWNLEDIDGDVDDFKRIHSDQLIALPGVRQTRTFFVMKEVVDNAPLEF